MDQSSTSRELKRNKSERGYRAHRKSYERRHNASTATKMKPAVLELIARKLHQYWSQRLEERAQCLSHESIYRQVWHAGGSLRRRGTYYQWCGSHGKTSRGQIKTRVSIDERPTIVDDKAPVAHWQIDTVIGKGHKGVLLTIVESVTKYTRSCRVTSTSVVHVTTATIALLSQFTKLVLSITADNGKEFAFHERIAQILGCKMYFAHPYSSRQRGLNENTNGLVRQYFPK